MVEETVVVGMVETEDVDVCHQNSPQATTEAASITQMTTEEGEDTTITLDEQHSS
jgi:hypothetical protein